MGFEVECCENVEQVVKNLGHLLETRSKAAISSGSLFKVGLSGGSLVKFLCQILPTLTTEWSKWRFFFCDERLVPFNDGESTFGLYEKELLKKIPVSVEQFVTLNPELSVEAAAEDYHQKLLEYFPTDQFPRFDVLLLGMGPDGHTCSLFPNHKLLKEAKKWVAYIDDSPKPPPQRITLTLPVLNNAKCCVFAVAGESKAATVKDIIDNPGNLPASMVRPTDGDVFWILDKAAGSLLSKK